VIKIRSEQDHRGSEEQPGQGVEESASISGHIDACLTGCAKSDAQCACESQAKSPIHRVVKRPRSWKAHPTNMTTNEIWRPVVDYAGLYSVSNAGHVRSERRVVMRGKDGTVIIPGRILATPPNTSGYPVCSLHRDGHQTTCYVHVLVARAFLGDPKPGQLVRHLDDVKVNNAVENLAYGSVSDNLFDAVANGRHAQANKTACINGHEFTDMNTYRSPSQPNRRVCIACDRMAGRRYRARLGAKSVAA
jgi:hypothetical protein